MSLNIGELVGYIKLDHTGVGQGITAAQRDMRQGMDRLAADAKGQGTKAGEAAGKGMEGGFSGSVGKLAKIAAGAFAVERVVAGLRTVKDAASDLNETTSMSGVIFGKNAGQMEAFAKNGPKALGLSTEATLRYSASLADMLLQLGYAEDATVSQSQATLQLAADLGSFKNLDTGDVLERISAALRGEYDSLQALIPNINAARVENEALALSGKASASDLTAQEKATATLAIVQKDGARAAGDFARTSDGAANSQKIAAATAQDLAAKFGQLLLPAYTAMVVYGTDEVLPFLEEFIDYLGIAGDAVGPVVGALGDVVGVFKDMPGPVQAATIGLIAMVALRGRVEALGASIQTGLGKGAASARGSLDSLRLGLMYASESSETAAGRFSASARAIGSTAATGIRGAATGLLGLLGGPWGLAFGGAIALLGTWMKRQQESRQRVESLTGSLDEQTGAITKNTREQVRNTLEASGALAAAAKAGLDLQMVFDAAMGNADAMARLAEETDRLLRTTTEYDVGGVVASGAPAIAALRGDLDTVNSALRTQSGELETARGAAERKAQVDVEGSGAQKDYGTSAKDTADKLAEQRDVLKEIAELTLELSNAQVTAVEAESAYEEAIDTANERLAKRKELEAELRAAETPEARAALRRELKDYALTLDLSTKAGRDNMSTLTDLRNEAYTLLETQASLGATTGELNGTMDDAREKFVTLADKFGLSRTEAEKLADKLGLSRDKVDELKTATDKLPTEKEIAVRVKAEAAKAELERLKTLLAGLKDKRVVVDVVKGVTYVNSGVSSPGGGSGTRGGIDAGTGGKDTFNSANGNILHFANGTEDHRAFIAGRGTPTRVFNEPETGGEGYIPLANDRRRPRATAILGTIADGFGYDLVAKGAGGPAVTSRVTKHVTPVTIGTAVFTDHADLIEQAEQHARDRNIGGDQ